MSLVTLPPPVSMKLVLVWWGRIAVAAGLGIAVADWIGWATGEDRLTRIFVSWPAMRPWSAVLVVGLAAAILLQSGRSSLMRVWAGRGLSLLACVVSATFLAEYVSGHSFGVDHVWFSDAVSASPTSWPGRPSWQTALSMLLLSSAVGLTRLDRRWTPPAWAISLVAAGALPFVVVSGYVYEALSVVVANRSNGMGVATAASVMLLVNAAFVARVDRNPLAWLLARPDRWSLVWLIGVLSGPPLVIGISRQALLESGFRQDVAWALAISLSTGLVGAAIFYLSQREKKLLIEREFLSHLRAEAEHQRADAEARYRILADNAVDVVVHVRGVEVVWISPSVQNAFGIPARDWIGSDFLTHVHPDDLELLSTALQDVAIGKTTTARFRVLAAEGHYHWVEGRGKPYVDAAGIIDGAIGSMRVIDDQVDTERRLQRMARFDPLTGLVNRAEALTQLQSELHSARNAGNQLGVLFCDIDRFKIVNDTWGHAAGDVVLSTVADRVAQCVRRGDTVGRTGGDEILVLLPGLHCLKEASQIGQKILTRIAEPIHYGGDTFHTTLSIGATLAVPGETVTATTARADAAMYQAKRLGGNTVTTI